VPNAPPPGEHPRRGGAGAGGRVQAKNRAAMEAAWNDDTRIEKMIYELNFGAFSKERLV